MNRRPAEQGSTLLELLVGLLFVAILAAALQQFSRAMVHGVRGLEAASEAQEAARVGTHLIAADLRHAGYGSDRRLGNGVRLARADDVRIAADLNLDGDTDDALESVGYRFDAATRTLQRVMGDAPPQPLLSDLAPAGFTAAYFDAGGTALPLDGGEIEASALARIRRIDVVLRVALPHPDPAYRRPIEVTQTASIALRNPP